MPCITQFVKLYVTAASGRSERKTLVPCIPSQDLELLTASDGKEPLLRPSFLRTRALAGFGPLVLGGADWC